MPLRFLFDRELFAAKEFLHQSVVGFGDELRAVARDTLRPLSLQIGGNFFFFEKVEANFVRFGVTHRFHGDEVNDTGEIAFGADGNLQRHGLARPDAL